MGEKKGERKGGRLEGRKEEICTRLTVRQDAVRKILTQGVY